ncbi:MAG TPA: hybrid sensor histidine kinase/response regulator [Spirochaetota bacterium]|nr:hybrid sensor histidine kinase/response regulator [Spirochaetota bacterium]
MYSIYMDRPAKILIIDDDRIEQEALKGYLEDDGYDIDSELEGKKGVELIRNNKYDLIILDVMIPDMNGFDICSLIKNDPATSDIPVIFLTGRDDSDSVIKGFEIGAQDYITKPFKGVELIARIKTQLDLSAKKKLLMSMNDVLQVRVEEKTLELNAANKKLSTLEKAKNDFLSLISHEIRTPLNGIVGFTALFETTELNEEQREYLEHLKNLTNKLLKMSELSLFITTLNVDEYDIRLTYNSVLDLITNTLEKYNSQLRKKRVTIRNNITSRDLKIKVDRELFYKSLEIIIDNAVDFSDERGTIDIDLAESGDYYVIIVKNKGVGFPEEALENPYELFNFNNPKYDGYNISVGLSAVNIIMNAHNGKIEIENLKNYGAAVKLYFNKD